MTNLTLREEIKMQMLEFKFEVNKEGLMIPSDYSLDRIIDLITQREQAAENRIINQVKAQIEPLYEASLRCHNNDYGHPDVDAMNEVGRILDACAEKLLGDMDVPTTEEISTTIAGVDFSESLGMLDGLTIRKEASE